MANLTLSQIRALIFNAVGRASETTTIPFNQLVVSTGNSGYSVGALQTDFGAFPSKGLDLLSKYQSWASANKQLSAVQLAEAKSVIIKRGLGSSGERLDSDVEENLNEFLVSNSGKAWVVARDEEVYQGKQQVIITPIATSENFASLSNTDGIEILARVTKAFNQNNNVGIHLRDEFLAGRLSTENFAEKFDARLSSLNANAQNALHSGQVNLMAGVRLFTKLNDSNGPITNLWRSVVASDPSMVATLDSDPNAKLFDALFRNPITAIGFIDKYEQGRPTLIIPSRKSLEDKVSIVGVDKGGRLFLFDTGQDSFKRFDEGQWNDSFGNYPRSDLPVLKQNAQGKWILALGNEQIELGDTAIAQVNINGTDVTLDASKAGQYAFMDDGVLIRASLSVDFRQESGEVLTGEFVGSTYNRTWRQGNPALQMSFAPEDGAIGASIDTLSVFTNGQGKTTTIDTSPVKMTIDGQERVIGYHVKTTVEQNGFLQSINDTTVTIHPQTSERTLTTDTSVYDGTTGQLASHNASTTVTSSLGLQLQALNITYNAQGQITQTSLTELQVNGAQITTVRDSQGSTLSTSNLRTFDDGSAISTTTYSSGVRTSLTSNSDGSLFSREVTIPKGIGSETSLYNGAGALQSITTRQGDDDGNTLVSVTTGAGTTTSAYDPGNNLISENFTPAGAVANFSSAGQTAVELIQFGQLLNSQVPGFIKLASGAVLLNNLATRASLDGTGLFSTGTGQVLGGIVSLYNLSNAWKYGDGLAKTTATLSSLNFVNQTLLSNGLGSTALNTTLNGSGLAGGAPGILPALGLISAIKANDPIGMTQSAIALFNPALLYSAGAVTPLGWVLIGASILQSFFNDDSPPDAWGVANVSFGPGITNYLSQVNATGENFGPERVRSQLQSTLDALNSIIAQTNSSNPDSNQHLGIIPQRLPSLNYRASEFADKGYAVTDIDALTGAQRFHNVRFDDGGQVFNLDPNSVTPELRAMLSLTGAPNYPQLNAYMLNSALDRQAIAPLWEVQTARMQETAGDPNAGLTEEERAAKAGLGAAVDGAYVQNHPDDINASKKRIGRFMPIGIDLDRNGRVSTLTNAQTSVTFDWDGLGYQKQTGWIAGNDGFLVLDRNFNQSVDNGTEILSNPLVADPAKGLRSLAAFDANADGKIDASDPVYAQLRVWQDLDQDGNNTHGLQFGPYVEVAQDGVNGIKELRSLGEWGITAIDYSNGRYEFSSASSANGVGYGQIATQTLEAEEEGVLYTPVGAGIRIDATNARPEIVITQVLSAAAVYSQYVLEAGGETIGVPGAELYEDGIPASYNPNTQGGPIPITISAAQLLGNDTWHGLNGAAAGLAISGVGNASRLGSLSLTAEGNVRLTLEANYNGAAGFDYTVTSPDGQIQTARVNLNITPVNDAPSVTVTKDPTRPVYGYRVLGYSYTVSDGRGEDGVTTTYSGAATGGPIYQPYVEEIPGPALYQDQVTGDAENGYTVTSVFMGYGPSTYINRFDPVAQETPNAGYVSGQDPDGGGSFSFQLVGSPIYGTAAVDASTGRWSYLGKRPGGIEVDDVNGDGTRDWLNIENNTITLNMPGANTDSNSYGGNEQRFTDYFTVRVHDGSGGYTDTQIDATHYGPPPAAIVASSGGGKKPIAMDLDGNGFQFTDVDDSNVFLDVNGDGWKRRSAWIKPGDGLLAFDRDVNGKIEGIDEIAFVGYAPDQQTDLAALRKAFDTNNNGVLDTGDAKWSQFGVWQDSNSNGIQEAGEFRSLTDMGISTIGLTSDGQFQVINGQTVHGLASATRTDGSTLAVADVTLRYTNEAKLPATNPDGTPGSATVTVSKYGQGREFLGTPDKDLVFGTAASDHFVTLDGDDVIVDDGGNDGVQAGAGNDLIYTGIDNDIINAGAGNDTVFAGAGNDLVFGDDESGSGDDLIMMEDGNDVAFGGGGNDFISGGLGNDVLSGNLGDDKLFGEDGWDALFGQEGNDELWGMAGNDLLDGGMGNDLLAGGAGDDVMEGGTGDDTYDVDSAADSVVELAGEGTDTVNASVSYTLADALEHLTLTGAGHLSGTGNAADNVLVGNDGNNTLTGLAGNDVLDGGLGADQMIGGTGGDIYVVDHAGDRVIEAAGEGTDTVRSRISYSLTANMENLSLVGIKTINATGNELDNVLVGNSAANVLDGGAGVDVMRGGLGNDTYIVDNASDSVIENASEGTDTVLASVSYTLSANVESLILSSSAVTATGNDLDNTLLGNAQANVLDGGAGADMMMGGQGDDTYHVGELGDAVVEAAGEGKDTVVSTIDYRLGTHLENLTLADNALNATGNGLNNVLTGNAQANVLDGGAGADQMAGSTGDDTYVVDDTGDNVLELAGEGSDTVLAGVSYSLVANVENLTLTGAAAIHATGNEFDNLITGNSGANRIDGGAGADRLSGGAGDDTYGVDNVGDSVAELADEGADTVLASVSYSLSDHVENLTLTGTEDLSATGNELDNSLFGNAGNNTLDGAAGADVMAGGVGDDIYLVDNAGDSVLELVDEGVDSVLASVSCVLSENAENMTLTGSAAIDATGNDRVNTLIGNAGANRLDGRDGADVMAGGAGDDTYVVDNLLDTVTEQADEGIDTVLSSISYTLSSHVENLVLAGSASIDATGNTLNNTLTGNAGNNWIDGSLGADAMAGDAGDDIYGVDDAGDMVTEWFDAGADTVLASISYVLPQHVENLRLTGRAITAAGNAMNNQLYGNVLDNLIDGDAGADQMVGAAGDDTYVVDDVGDTVVERVDEGSDTVRAGVSYGLSDNVENLMLTGTADLAATGNTRNNVILGNTGNNLIDGGMGADVMAGGAGNDRYLVDDSLDTVTEMVAGGVDTIESSVSYTLSSQVENLVLTGTAIEGIGNDLDNRLAGNTLDNRLDGAAGADVMAGGAGNDTYVVDNAADTIEELAGDGNDTIQSSVSYTLAANVENLLLTGTADIGATGNELDNTLAGNTGNNALAGGAGNDAYVYTVGGGLDTITDTSGIDTVSFGPGLTLDNVALRIATVNGQKIAQIRVLDATGNEMADQGIDYVMGIDAQSRLTSSLESFVFADGGTYLWHDLLIQSTALIGTNGADLLLGGRHDDSIYGRNDRDVLYGGSGHDQLFGESGDDILFGGGGNDKLYGGNGDDELHGETGNDLLYGDNGNDLLIDLQGDNTFYGGNHDDVVMAGAGNDIIYSDLAQAGAGAAVISNGCDIVQAGAGVDRIDTGNENDLVDAGTGDDFIGGGNSDDWIAAGKGNDMIDGGNGRNLYAFNRGDGADLLSNSGNGRDTVSLGGSIRYADLSLAKAGNDLVLDMGQGDSMTLKNWYLGGNAKNVEKLQVVTVGGDYDATSTDKSCNQQVEVFDFSKLVQKFDAARTAGAVNANGWTVMNGLLDAHLQGSNTAALGGDLSYQYATAGSLAGIGLGAAQSSLAAGTEWQNLKSRSQLEQGSVKLM